jgi:hypothetical protein
MMEKLGTCTSKERWMPEPDRAAVSVESDERGVIRAAAAVRFVRRPQAEALCGGIRESAAALEAPQLMMDMRALSRATPAAGLYALRQLRTFPVERIALVGANRFMRGFAALVLRAGRFPKHRFFDDEQDAVVWLLEDRGGR